MVCLAAVEAVWRRSRLKTGSVFTDFPGWARFFPLGSQDKTGSPSTDHSEQQLVFLGNNSPFSRKSRGFHFSLTWTYRVEKSASAMLQPPRVSISYSAVLCCNPRKTLISQSSFWVQHWIQHINQSYLIVCTLSANRKKRSRKLQFIVLKMSLQNYFWEHEHNYNEVHYRQLNEHPLNVNT